MEYNEFINNLKSEIAKLCHEKDVIIINSVRKNNSQRHDAITIKREGESSAPAIYLKCFYEDYKKGISIEQIAKTIYELDKENRDKVEFDLDEFFVWDNVKDKIFCRLINRINNAEMLKNIPYKAVCDLALVCYCKVDTSDFDLATTMVQNMFLEKWEIGESELFDTAMNNTRKVQETLLISMDEMLMELLASRVSEDFDNDSFVNQIVEDDRMYPMYVLTNKNKLLGSVCMAYEDLLHDFAMDHGNFYIIPSSIHELILVPEGDEITPAGLLNMIIEVNDGQVPKEEILSYNLYYYDIMKHKLSVINNVKQKIC